MADLVTREATMSDEKFVWKVYSESVRHLLSGQIDEAEKLLPVDTPFGSGIKKWQLPIDMLPQRVLKTVFPPNTKVKSNIHPEHTEESPSGGVRIVVSGEVYFKQKKFGPGDWFFAANGEPYEFTTHPTEETVVFYNYAFFAVEEGNRFSHPHAHHLDNVTKL